MEKLYCKTVNNDKILQDKVLEVEDFDKDNFFNVIAYVCEQMDLSTPVILNKHYEQMVKFNHSVFLANEFLEDVDFKRFIVERFDDDENSKQMFMYDDF